MMKTEASEAVSPTRPADQDARWSAIVRRDRDSDGKFYYSVKSTGVYCLPSCAARLANPGNVRFHLTVADARQAGFRPCKRCKPDQFVAASVTLHYAVGRCSLGTVLVARSVKGICAILIGDTSAMLVGDLHTRFARHRLINCDHELQPLLKEVVGLMDCPGRGTKEPLDMRGTEFQCRVWAAVLKIPPGRTASYGDVARSAGVPKAVRAVAHACSANPIAVAIPCHRVVKDDGTLSGYRWGIKRKRALLARETAT